jgi:hypothetical protein
MHAFFGSLVRVQASSFCPLSKVSDDDPRARTDDNSRAGL